MMMDLNELLTQYRDMYVELQPAIDQMDALKKKITQHVKETGETGNVDGVMVSIRKGSERATWDGKALKGYAAAHPEIEQFCTVSVTSPAVTIKVN